MAIPQCNSIIRATYAFHIAHKNISIHTKILDQCKSAQVSIIGIDNPDVVVIIGESHSVRHSQLYGYDKPTEPKMYEIMNDSSMTIFRDAISPWDMTLKAMHSVFSLAGAEHGLSEAPLFPALFKKAGYRTVMLDNQYIVGNSITLLADKDLSEIMFDERNDITYLHDSEMLSTLTISEKPSLYVIHLMGQHYTYSDRYPSNQRLFSESNYPDSYSKEEREIIAHYDNATIATDSNLREIIDKFQNRDCAIIFFSDHGEELYESGKGIGHGFAAESCDLGIQLNVPLWIWLSPEYRHKRPEIASTVASSAKRRITTNDASHTILELGQISTPLFDPARSFISSQYDETKKRIVLNSIDFDLQKQ